MIRTSLPPVGVLTGPGLLGVLAAFLSLLGLSVRLFGQQVPSESQPKQLPQLVDITDSSGIRFEHLSSSDKKYIVESMAGGVALIDYDRDGLPDIYFTNAPTVEMALAGNTAPSALYHSNVYGTLARVSDMA